MSRSLAAVLPSLSRSSLIVLLHLSAQAQPGMLIDTSTRGLVRASGLHHQSVYTGLKQLQKAGLVDLKKGPRRGWWSVWLFPVWEPAFPWPLAAVLEVPSAARDVLPVVSPTKTTKRIRRR